MTEHDRIAELTAAAAKGDTAAFESLYATFGKRVYYFCRCLIGDENAAVKATKDSFLYAWRNLRTLPAGQPFYRWLCSNAFYFAKIELASLRETGIAIEETDCDPALFDTMNETDGAPIAEPSIRRGDLETVTMLLDDMPDSDRICMMLYDYAGFSPEEAAETADCSVTAFKCHVYAAHVAVIEGLNGHAEGMGDSLRPYLGRLLRTCGRNCRLPSAVTEELRKGLKQSAEEEFPPHEIEEPVRKGFSLSKATTTVLYVLLGLCLVGGVVYVIYWFSGAPPFALGDASSEAESTVSEALSTEQSHEESYGISLDESSEESSAADTSSEAVSGDESEPEESSEETSAPEESSEDTSSEEESSEPPAPAALPRTTANLRLRSTPDTTDSNNLITTIPKGSHIDIKETVTADDGSTWYYVRYTNAAGVWFEGYCSADYVQTEE